MALTLVGAQVVSVPARAQSGNQSAPADAQKPAQSQDIPDAPSVVQPPTAPPPERLDKPPANPPDADKAGNQPGSKPPAQSSKAGRFRPRWRRTAAPSTHAAGRNRAPGQQRGSVSKAQPSAKADLLTFMVHVNSVQVPVMVKDREGRRVDGLRPADFTVLENGKPQKLSYFTTDPFELSVAVVIDTGMPDVAVQKINQTFSALVEAFSAYDEVALYTYSSTVSQVSTYQTTGPRLTAVLNQMKTETGHENGVAVLSGPMASGPIVNGVPVGKSVRAGKYASAGSARSE